MGTGVTDVENGKHKAPTMLCLSCALLFGIICKLSPLLPFFPFMYIAFVIYNFVRLCTAYVGGESAILAEISGKPIP